MVCVRVCDTKTGNWLSIQWSRSMFVDVRFGLGHGIDAHMEIDRNLCGFLSSGRLHRTARGQVSKRYVSMWQPKWIYEIILMIITYDDSIYILLFVFVSNPVCLIFHGLIV